MATTNTNLSNYNPSTLPDATKLRFGIVVSEWNSVITEGLLEGARDTFLNCGVQRGDRKSVV